MKIEETVYLDHQATTPIDSAVFQEMVPYLENLSGNPHSADHAIGWRASQAVDKASADVAALLGCDSDEIVFTSGATEANNLALLGIAKAAANGSRKRILLSAIEHKCVLEIGRVLTSQAGYRVEIIPVNEQGHVDLDVLESTVSDDVLLLSAMAVNNEIGTIQNIKRIAEIANASGALLHCDAAQAPCATDISNLGSQADLVSLSSHKMYGPAGIGALYARRELHQAISPVILGGGQQNGLRSGTLPTALCVGFGAAARLISSEEWGQHRERISGLRDLLLTHLEDLPCSIWVNGPARTEEKHPGNLNVGFEGISAADLLSRLQPLLAASSGSACTSGIPEPSHVLREIGLNDERASSSIRLSLGKHTTADDIQEAAFLIRNAIADLSENGLLRAS